MTGAASMKAWLPVALLVGVWTASPAQAGGRGEEAYDRASDFHHDRRWDDAAAGFIAAYTAGYREETSAYNAACALARGGRKDLAFAWLERAFEDGFDLEEYLDDDDDLRSLRADARFAALHARVLGGRTSKKVREGERLSQRFQALRAQKATRPNEYDDVGRELLGADRYEEAAQAFETAAARETDPATSLYNAACARSLQGNKAAALDLLARAVAAGFADPEHMDEDDDLDNIRGTARYAEIRALAEELDTPGYPSSLRDRDGKSRREWQAALPRIENAVRRHPSVGLAWFNLGFAKLALGQPDQAVAPFEKAILLNHRKATSMYNLACAHALSHHVDEAFAWLDRAVNAGFDNFWLLRQDEDLDELRGDPRFRKFVDLARAQQKHWD